MKLNTKPLKEIEIGFPILAAGTYFAKVLKKDIEPNKAGNGNNLVLQFQILDDKLINNKGEQLDNRGQVKLTSWIGLVPTDDYDPNTRIKELALASGKDKDSEDDFDTTDIVEYMKIVLAVRPAGPDKKGVHREEANEIKRFKPILPEDKFTPPGI